jgi:ABC-type phosphate transport system substrate-binding protein
MRLALACALLLVAGVARADFVAIKNAKNPTPAATLAELKNVFSGRTKAWSNGEPIVLVIGTEDSPAMKWLAESVFNVSTKLFLSKIKQDVFHGDLLHPLSGDDDGKTIARVQSGAGVVGWVTPEAVRTLPAGVAVLSLR